MGNRSKRTEHAGPKRGCGSFCGRKHLAKSKSAIRRRQAERHAIAEQQREVDPRPRR